MVLLFRFLFHDKEHAAHDNGTALCKLLQGVIQFAHGIGVEGLGHFFHEDAIGALRRLAVMGLDSRFGFCPCSCAFVYEFVAKFRVLCDGVRKFIFD